MPKHPLFAQTTHFIFDMDGTLYLDDVGIPGAVATLQTLRARGYAYRLFSNNSSNSAALCHARLARLGLDVPPEDIWLSSDVAADFLLRQHPGEAVFLLGNAHLQHVLATAGVPLSKTDPKLVLLGFDTTLTYEKIRCGASWIAQGLPYYATHPDIVCPAAHGILPDAGSLAALFAAATGRWPVTLGKPERPTVAFICQRLQCNPQQLCFVGDRLETDIALSQHGGRSVLCLSGVTTRSGYAAQSRYHADLVLDSLADLAPYL